MSSTLTKSQVKNYGPVQYEEGGIAYRIRARVRYDDQCDNGHNTFAITGEIDRLEGKRWREDSGGCIHGEIAKHFPELAPFIKWHLCSSDGPLHYVANTVYLAGDRDCWGLRRGEGKDRELSAARRAAIWPDATDEDLTAPGLEQRLEARLPALLAEFRKAVESLGFVF